MSNKTPKITISKWISNDTNSSGESTETVTNPEDQYSTKYAGLAAHTDEEKNVRIEPCR